jgi:ribose transport system substrate-binding protein
LSASAALGALVAVGPSGCTGDAGQPGSKALRIAVIPKGTTHVFWKSVERGARRAGEQLGVDILWKGPAVENDRAGQIQLTQDFLTQAVDGLVLAPLDHKALVAPVRQAAERGIPVVIFDSSLDGKPGDDFAAFVATDNLAAGRMAGEELARLLGGRGKVVLLRYQVGSASTEARERGFLAAVGACEGLTVTSENRYAGATAGEAKTQALNLLDALRDADGIFCPNESSTQGMLLALRQEGLAGHKRFVGFDASPPLVEALRRGEIDALVVQDPETMGAKAVELVVQAARGARGAEGTASGGGGSGIGGGSSAAERSAAERSAAGAQGAGPSPAARFVHDTGAVLVTTANIDSAAVQRLLR